MTRDSGRSGWKRDWVSLGELTAAVLLSLATVVGCGGKEGHADGERVAHDRSGITATLFRHVVPESGPPKAFLIAGGIELTPQEFLDQHAEELWDLGPVDEVRFHSTIAGSNGHTKVHYRQLHAG